MCIYLDFSGGASAKEHLPMQETKRADSISGLGRAPGGRHGNSLKYSCMENRMDRGAWQL